MSIPSYATPFLFPPTKMAVSLVYRAGTEHGPVFDVGHHNDEFEESSTCNSVAVFRAGTKEGPLFQTENDDKVWIITDPKLYYLLDKSENVYLWKAVIQNAPDIIEEKQSRYSGICKLKLETKGKKHLEQTLASLPWTKAVVPQKGGGMSLIAKNTLVQAILDYMYYNYPTTPEEFNFQAELKAVCHWRWLEKNELPQFIPGPHDDFRIKRAVNAALIKWKKDLSEAKRLGPGTGKPPCAKKVQNDKKGSDSSSDTDQESISDLEDDIFDLTMYYHKYLTA